MRYVLLGHTAHLRRKGKVTAMVAGTAFPWEEDSAVDVASLARAAWREAVTTVTAKAHNKLPECNGSPNDELWNSRLQGL